MSLNPAMEAWKAQQRAWICETLCPQVFAIFEGMKKEGFCQEAALELAKEFMVVEMSRECDCPACTGQVDVIDDNEEEEGD